MLDASALLVLLNDEPGAAAVAAAIPEAVLCSVNHSEVLAKLLEVGVPEEVAREALDTLALAVVDFDQDLSWRAARLRPRTRSHGLSLGDRACLALAEKLQLPALTADRAWAGLASDIEVCLVR